MLGWNLQARAGLEHDIDIHQVRINRHRRAFSESFARNDGERDSVRFERRQEVFGMMGETRLRLFQGLGQGDPDLLAEHRPALRLEFRRRTLRMDDAPARRHPVHVAGPDRHNVAGAVAMNHLALEQIAQRRKADMRMRPDLRAGPGAEHDRSEMVEEDEGTDRPALRGRQRATNLEAITKIPNRWKQNLFHRQVDRRTRNGHCRLLRVR